MVILQKMNSALATGLSHCKPIPYIYNPVASAFGFAVRKETAPKLEEPAGKGNPALLPGSL